jgi:hypothetical protein
MPGMDGCQGAGRFCLRPVTMPVGEFTLRVSRFGELTIGCDVAKLNILGQGV